MKVREAGFAYDIEPVKDPSTMLFRHFKVTIDKLDIQGDKKVFEGTAKSFEEAKALAEHELERLRPQREFRKAG